MATNATQIPGIDLTGIRRWRDGWQVRIYPFPAKNYGADELLAAIAWRDKLVDLRARGIRELPAIEADSVSIGAIAKKVREQERKRMTQKGLSQSSFDKLDHKLRPWLGEEEATDALGRPIHERAIAGWTAGEAQEYVTDRSLTQATTARDHLAGLRMCVRYAQNHDVRVDHRILDSKVVRGPVILTREGIALSYPELQYVASFAFERMFRLWLLNGTIGNRIMELLQATDDWLDAAAQTLTVPAEHCKERRTKVIPLFPDEVALFVEQQSARVTSLRGPRLFFPRARGTAYKTEAGFWHMEWAPTIRRALRAYEAEHGVEPRWAWWMRDENGEVLRTKDGKQRSANHAGWVLKRGVQRFDGLEPHDLRRTAISLMREMKMPEEHVAARVGHLDEKQQKTYRLVRPDEQRREIRRIGVGLGAALLAAHAADAEAGEA